MNIYVPEFIKDVSLNKKGGKNPYGRRSSQSLRQRLFSLNKKRGDGKKSIVRRSQGGLKEKFRK